MGQRGAGHREDAPVSTKTLVLRAVLVAAVLVAAAMAEAPKWETIVPPADLAGWRVVSGEWRVENGELVGSAKSGQAAIMLERPLEDFDADCEMAMPAPCAGGLVARGHDLPALPLAAGSDPATAPKKLYGYFLGFDASNVPGSASFTVLSFPEEDVRAAATQVPPSSRAWHALSVRAHGDAIDGSINNGPRWRISNDRFVKGGLAFTVGEPGATTPAEGRFRHIRVRDFGREGAWTPLWNGIDFSQFEFFGEEEWRVLDGGIVGTSGKKKSEGYAKTRATFKDFRVRGTYRMFGDGNYGLFYHSTIAYDEKRYPIISGVQGEVAWGYPSATGCLYESYKRGWIEKPVMARLGAFAQDMKGLNEIEVLAQGDRRATWVNGIKVTDLIDPTPAYTEGAFALQLHTGGVSGIMWKDLYVIDLDRK